jgi:hypothetical protein
MGQKIWRNKLYVMNQKEAATVAWGQLYDAIIGILSNGRYCSSYSSDAIEKGILAGIERRRKERCQIK